MRFPLLLALLVNVRKMVCGLTRRNVLLHSKTAVGGVPSQCGHPKLNNANLKEKSSSCQPWSSQLHSQQSASCLPHLLPHNCHICWEGSFDCSSDKKMKGGEQERHQIFTSWLRTGFYFNPTTWTRRSFGSLLPGAEQRPPDVWKKPSQLRFNSIYCLAQTLIWYYLIAIRIFINICDKVMGSALHLVLLHMHWRASPPLRLQIFPLADPPRSSRCNWPLHLPSSAKNSKPGILHLKLITTVAVFFQVSVKMKISSRQNLAAEVTCQVEAVSQISVHFVFE